CIAGDLSQSGAAARPRSSRRRCRRLPSDRISFHTADLVGKGLHCSLCCRVCVSLDLRWCCWHPSLVGLQCCWQSSFWAVRWHRFSCHTADRVGKGLPCACGSPCRSRDLRRRATLARTTG